VALFVPAVHRPEALTDLELLEPHDFGGVVALPASQSLLKGELPGSTFDYHAAHPEFARLLQVEGSSNRTGGGRGDANDALQGESAADSRRAAGWNDCPPRSTPLTSSSQGPEPDDRRRAGDGGARAQSPGYTPLTVLGTTSHRAEDHAQHDEGDVEQPCDDDRDCGHQQDSRHGPEPTGCDGGEQCDTQGTGEDPVATAGGRRHCREPVVALAEQDPSEQAAADGHHPPIRLMESRCRWADTTSPQVLALPVADVFL
jgi:hypothetical protein